MKDLYVEYSAFMEAQKGDVDFFVKSQIKASIECLVDKSQKKNVNLDDINVTIPVSEMDENDCERISESLSGALCLTIVKATENLKKLSSSGVNFDGCAKEMMGEAVKNCRNDIGKDENIPEKEKKSVLKSICKWVLDLSRRETIKNISIIENNDTEGSTSLEKVELPDNPVDLTNQVADYLNTASVYNAVISSGTILKQVNENLDSEKDDRDSGKIPNIIRKAFETEILSDEEMVFKKLLALERFLIALEKFGWNIVLSPIAVVRIAQDAFVYVNDVKASYKRVLMVQDAATAKEVL